MDKDIKQNVCYSYIQTNPSSHLSVKEELRKNHPNSDIRGIFSRESDHVILMSTRGVDLGAIGITIHQTISNITGVENTKTFLGEIITQTSLSRSYLYVAYLLFEISNKGKIDNFRKNILNLFNEFTEIVEIADLINNLVMVVFKLENDDFLINEERYQRIVNVVTNNNFGDIRIMYPGDGMCP